MFRRPSLILAIALANAPALGAPRAQEPGPAPAPSNAAAPNPNERGPKGRLVGVAPATRGAALTEGKRSEAAAPKATPRGQPGTPPAETPARPIPEAAPLPLGRDDAESASPSAPPAASPPANAAVPADPFGDLGVPVGTPAPQAHAGSWDDTGTYEARPQADERKGPAPTANPGGQVELDLDPAASLPDTRRPAIMAPIDDQVERVQSPAGPIDENPLPSARERPGESAPYAPETPIGDPHVLPAERLSTGPNAVGVTVEVIAPDSANLHKPHTFHIKVKNNGPGEAAGIAVRYLVPENLEYIESDPVAERQGPLLIWQLNTLASGAEKTIKVKVQPRDRGAYDHAATVTLRAGARARTMVRKPELKVEVRPDKARPLKGVPVVYDIVITNVGDHPARDVSVHARLSPGLSHPRGSDLVLTAREEPGLESLEPGESLPLRLEVDTKAMGKQACEVVVASPDLPTEERKTGEIDVVAPELRVAIEGPRERYPDNVVDYRLVVTNAGSAPARKVRIAAHVPTSGSPMEGTTRGYEWDKDRRRFYWQIAELGPNDSASYNIRVRMGGVGLFRLTAGAVAEGMTAVSRAHDTDIKGFTRLQFSVNEPRGVLDAGEESFYEIRLRNDGSKEATHVLVMGVVSDNLQVIGVGGPDVQAANPPQADPQKAVLPEIERLPPGGDVTLTIRVKALRGGDGTCTVEVRHDDIQVPMSQTVITRITGSGGGP
jgi:uncharacterized repeat protein (TIGR01451 family)